MPSEPTQPSTAGIVIDKNSGERQIPESLRADGTRRKAIKIRPGYRPPEDVELYKNRTAESFRNRGKGGIPGIEGLREQRLEPPASVPTSKNAKRREARKKAREEQPDATTTAPQDAADAQAAEPVDPEVEREKKARNLRKKLKQAKMLKSLKEEGETLLPEQIAKVIKINELIRELGLLGFDSEGEPKASTSATQAETATAG